MPTFLARVDYTGDGVTDVFAFSFPYLDADHVKLYVGGVEDTGAVVTGVPASGGTIAASTPPTGSAEVKVVRETSPTVRLVDYQNSAVLDEATLDTDSLQAFYRDQETADTATQALADAEQALVTAGATTSAVDAAQAAAEAAQAAAETAQSGAETAETNAAASAAAAAVSASDAADSAAEAAAIVSGQVINSGTWDASGGTYPSSPVDNALYRINVAGTLGGEPHLQGDFIFYDGAAWWKWDNTEPQSVLREDDFNSIFVDAPADQDYYLTRSAPSDLYVETVSAVVSAGTCTVALKYGSGPTTVATLSVSATVTEDTAPSVTIPKGSAVFITVSGTSSAENLEIHFGG